MEKKSFQGKTVTEMQIWGLPMFVMLLLTVCVVNYKAKLCHYSLFSFSWEQFELFSAVI
jgi:hypothetical protein